MNSSKSVLPPQPGRMSGLAFGIWLIIWIEFIFEISFSLHLNTDVIWAETFADTFDFEGHSVAISSSVWDSWYNYCQWTTSLAGIENKEVNSYLADEASV